jgi:glutamine cyclotransferase
MTPVEGGGLTSVCSRERPVLSGPTATESPAVSRIHITMKSRAARRALAIALVLGSSWLASRNVPELRAQGKAPVETFRVVKSYPHDAEAYTQGLIYRDGFLFESTGLNGRSTLRKVRLETGEVVQQHRLANGYFAEGLAEWNGQLVQLTWRSNIAFVYDLASFASRRTLTYTGEGWGLTRDREGFILSDGTGQLRFLHPDTFREVRRVTVTDGGVPVRDLNELEYIRGEVYANVWHTDRIARISPQSGRVMGWIDLRGLMSTGYRLDSEAVLNGIAYDAAGNRLFVTGKLWPRLFEIQVVPRQ